MFKHLFVLIWNKKKQNFLLITEILVSFLVIFAVFTLLVYNYKNYRKPMGFDYENVWAASYTSSLKTTNTDSLNLFYETLRKTIKSLPRVKEISFSSNNIPLYQNRSQSQVTYNKKNVDHVNWYRIEEGYKQVLNLQVLEGRWFDRQDAVAKNKPVVINNMLKKAVFGNGEAIGKLLGDDPNDKNKMQVIGVVENVKAQGDYAEPGLGLYEKVDTASFRWLGKILIRVTPDSDAAFEGLLYKTMSNYMKDSNVEIEHLTDKRKTMNYFSLVPMIVLLVVAGFLIINVALGLFGVLWYNINKRRGEIGLRRAIGASGKSVSGQLVSESLILATFSLLIGVFFAVQFPLLHVFDLAVDVYLTAIILSILFIYLLVLICSWYPGKQAAGIYPAVALHEE